MPASSRTSPEPLVTVTDLSVRRGSVGILRNISWTIRRGEHWVLLGANGSGKTSLLSALTGYLMPSAGDITVLGETYGQSDWRDLRIRIGLVSSSVRQQIQDDEPALHVVAGGVRGILNYWGTPPQRDRHNALRLLRQIGCIRLKDRPWGVLSQGERQRVLIARALAAQPEILIVDEPCAGLDPVARQSFLDFLDRLSRRRQGPAVVLVTHHVEEITPGFTHALILREGRRIAQGPLRVALNSRALSEALGTACRLSRTRAGYRLAITSPTAKKR